MSVTPYTTAPAIQTRISSAGVSLRVDHDATATAQCISDASTEINGYCQLLYSVEALAASAWVELKARDIAVYFLCLLRNNPVPQVVQARYDKAIKDLERVQAGGVQIPDAAMRRAAVPTLSNQRVRLQPVPQVVTVTGLSTYPAGQPSGYVQHTDDRSDNTDYSI